MAMRYIFMYILRSSYIFLVIERCNVCLLILRCDLFIELYLLMYAGIFIDIYPLYEKYFLLYIITTLDMYTFLVFFSICSVSLLFAAWVCECMIYILIFILMYLIIYIVFSNICMLQFEFC